MSSIEEQAARELTVPVSDDGGAALRSAIDEAIAWTAAGAERSARVVLAPGCTASPPPIPPRRTRPWSSPTPNA
ncbi:hypothetical protein G4G29_02675 [Microbacterium sp. Se63.02b]|nr:hypothetical protein G4G29_02675 [Microbacterium sp. Se63.02b]